MKEEIAKFTSRIDLFFEVKEGGRIDARELQWWLKDFEDKESSTTDRNLAYLRFYRRVAGGPKLLAEGLLLDRRRVWMDRSVIRRLVRDGYVSFVDGKDPFFQITTAGEELIAE